MQKNKKPQGNSDKTENKNIYYEITKSKIC